MSQPTPIQFFITPEHPCSYLDERKATTLFLDPHVVPDLNLYTQLSENGFRRSGNHFYRPHCKACDACIPVRISAAEFNPNKTQKRVWKKNQDLEVKLVTPHFTKEHYTLYERYICTRHEDGDMYPPTKEQYRSFLVEGWQKHGFFLEFRKDNALLAIAVVDELESSLSAVYTFFDPNFATRSLGTFALLWQLNYCLDHSLSTLYLGYWIKECPKMRYKTSFRPVELFINGSWVALN